MAATLQVSHSATRAQRHVACILQLPGAGMHITAFSSQQQYLKLSRGQHVALEAADRSPSAQQHHTASDAPPGMEDRAEDSGRTSDDGSGQGGDAGQPGRHHSCCLPWNSGCHLHAPVCSKRAMLPGRCSPAVAALTVYGLRSEPAVTAGS